jgi:linoleate 10R-lipoxygenase
MGPTYQFRTADGFGNSQLAPTMGQSFTPYSRSCSTTRSVPPIELPDAGLVFDALIRRDKVNSLFLTSLSSLAINIRAKPLVRAPSCWTKWIVLQLCRAYWIQAFLIISLTGTSLCSSLIQTTVIHSVFRTSRNDWNINETSSYADLGLLYGNNQAQQDKVRNKDGRGRLLPDVFSETRLFSLPPGVSAVSAIWSSCLCFCFFVKFVPLTRFSPSSLSLSIVITT